MAAMICTLIAQLKGLIMSNYTYNAKITRVVDGDTVDAIVDLGFNVKMNIRFRLEGYDSPETYRPKNKQELAKGREATKALIDMIGGAFVDIESSKHGKYRWLGTIYQLGETVSVNQKMIDMGHVKEKDNES